MIKLRVEGKRKDIYKYLDLLQQDAHITVCDISNCYPNHGVSLYNRCFVEIEINGSQEEDQEKESD